MSKITAEGAAESPAEGGVGIRVFSISLVSVAAGFVIPFAWFASIAAWVFGVVLLFRIRSRRDRAWLIGSTVITGLVVVFAVVATLGRVLWTA